jgi:hypothetical protein
MSGVDHTRIGFAEACREAGLAFMSGVASGWDRRDLAVWLLQKYGKLAVKPKVPGREVTPESGVQTETISDLLREARWKAFAALEEAAAGQARFVQEVAGKGLIMRDEKLGWVPVDRAGARLRGRVLSVFAIDCLVRPSDYRTLLFACPRCESIVFDAAAKEVGRCCGTKPVVEGGSGQRPAPTISDFRRSVPRSAIDEALAAEKSGRKI